MRRAPLGAVVLLVPTQLAVLAALLGRAREPLAVLGRATGGFVNPSLPLYGIAFLVTVVPLALVWGGLRPRDIGLRRRGLGLGLLTTAGTWLVLQAAEGGASWLRAGGVVVWRGWGQPVPALSFLVAMLLAAPLVYEASYRGFALPQLEMRLPGGRRERLVKAVLLSALLSALVQLPYGLLVLRLDTDSLVIRTIGLTLTALLFGALYVRTGNLWVAGGIHALMRAPTPLFRPVFPAWWVTVPVMLALVLFWPRSRAGGGWVWTRRVAVGEAAAGGNRVDL